MKQTLTRRLPCALCALALCAGLSVQALAAEPDDNAPDCIVSWETLEERVLANSLSAQALQENIESIQALNYDKLKDTLRDQLNGLADLEFFYYQMNDAAGAKAIHQNYELLRDQFDAVRDGDMQKDNADIVRQIENGTRQLVMGAQSLYLGLVQMQDQLDDVDRGLAALDRNLTELRLRQSLGQVPEQTVLDVEETRSNILSQRSSLETTISAYSIQLQILVGENPTGKLTLGSPPQVTAEELESLDYEEDLAAAKEASWSLYSAQLALEDAEETWEDAKKEYSCDSYQRKMAEHTWNAENLSYQAAVESFEISFRTLYDAMFDKQQALSRKESAAAHQEQAAAIAQRKYELGIISRFSLLAAQDDLEAARSEEESARLALFTAYHNYQNAVKYGILN